MGGVGLLSGRVDPAPAQELRRLRAGGDHRRGLLGRSLVRRRRGRPSRRECRDRPLVRSVAASAADNAARAAARGAGRDRVEPHRVEGDRGDGCVPVWNRDRDLLGRPPRPRPGRSRLRAVRAGRDSAGGLRPEAAARFQRLRLLRDVLGRPVRGRPDRPLPPRAGARAARPRGGARAGTGRKGTRGRCRRADAHRTRAARRRRARDQRDGAPGARRAPDAA
jgi:hypothetical protein